MGKITGLPEELEVEEALERETTSLRVRMERRRFGKPMTIIEGINNKQEAKQLLKKLRSKLACGGTYKEGRIELQGDHRRRIKDLLIEAGYKESQIDIIQ
jgi:translation initiation factor 1